ncbi:hypothetical protein [Streptosporangium sp. CA-115845]|uniref:hypothetical protein n=1 Tax=Streptosporangium sp. CA-115845 TaxID=3240071 RepID=UPI003D8AB6C7
MIVVLVALVGITFWKKPVASSDNRSTTQCVDTSSRQADGTHRIVDRRKCESDEAQHGQYRWQSHGKTSDSGRDRSVLRRIGDFIGYLFGGDGRRR